MAWSNPLVIAVLGATVAALGNMAVSWINGRDQRRLQEQNNVDTQRLESFKAESARVLEVIKTNDPDKAAVNLRFLLDSGLIHNEETAAYIRKYTDTRSKGQGPALPVGGPSPTAVAATIGFWKVTLSSYTKKDEYLDEIASPPRGWRSKASGNTLAIIQLLVQNNADRAVNVFFGQGCPGNTSLIGTSGEGYVPIHYDSRTSSNSKIVGRYSFPPSSSTKLAVVFEVPRALTPREMRLTIVEEQSELLNMQGCPLGSRNEDISIRLDGAGSEPK